jgi:RNA polymerase sigma-70 factor (ECF subfamily)
MSDVTMTNTGFTETELTECIPHLRRYAIRLRRNHHNAEDLLQDVLARAWRKRHLFENQGKGMLLRWLSTMMHNAGASGARTFGREMTATMPWPEDPVTGKPWDGGAAPVQTDGRVVVDDLARSLASLPPDQQQAFKLIAIDGLSYEEAAAIVGVPVGTIRSRLSRGRDQLRLAFEGEGHIHKFEAHPATPSTRRCACGKYQYTRARKRAR